MRASFAEMQSCFKKFVVITKSNNKPSQARFETDFMRNQEQIATKIRCLFPTLSLEVRVERLDDEMDDIKRNIGMISVTGGTSFDVTFNSTTLLECIGLDKNHWMAFIEL